jgi:arginase family enzyme
MQIIRIKLVNSDGRNKGCEKAPAIILECLKDINSNEKKEVVESETASFSEIHFDLKKLDEADYLIFEASKEAFERNFKTFFVGGDHSMDYSILRAFNKIEKKPFLIVFDAHADCAEKGGLNRRWIRKLIDSEFNPGSIVLISARNLDNGEIDFIKQMGVAWINMGVIMEDIAGVCDLVMERARNSSGFYISLDIDCVDPAFAPGTTDIEPGGILSRELIYFVKRLSLLKNFKGAGISEINPDKDINGMTLRLGAKLIAEMI